MRALVLGGNGFIGSHLVDRLLASQAMVRVFDRDLEMYREPMPGVEYHYGDFGNRRLVSDALHDMDIVFHLISTTVPKTSNDDPAFDVMSNVVETIHLLEQCDNHGIKKIVFVSSGGTVYGSPEVLPVSEDSSTNPTCSYGITKLMIEKYLSLFRILRGLDYAIVRPSNPYGERQNPLGIQGVIPVFLGKVARNMPIEVWGDGEVVRDYLYVEDLVDGIYKIAVADTQSKTFNLGSGTGLSLNDILRAIQEIIGCEYSLEVNYSVGRPFDIPAIYLDITRARTELGWNPTTPLKLGIQKTWEFVKQVV